MEARPLLPAAMLIKLPYVTPSSSLYRRLSVGVKRGEPGVNQGDTHTRAHGKGTRWHSPLYEVVNCDYQLPLIQERTKLTPYSAKLY